MDDGKNKKANKAGNKGRKMGPKTALGNDLVGTEHENIASDDYGHHDHNNEGKGKELVGEWEALNVATGIELYGNSQVEEEALCGSDDDDDDDHECMTIDHAETFGKEKQGNSAPVHSNEEERNSALGKLKEKGKGVVEMAANEEEGEQRKSNEQQEQRKGKRNDASTVKEKRLRWTPRLHYKFILAIEALGDNKVCPTSVHKMMNDPNLSRSQIATHIQTYRAHMRRSGQTSAGNKALSLNPNNAKYPYLPALEVKKALCTEKKEKRAMKKSRDVADQLTKEMSGGPEGGSSSTPNFLAPNDQVPLTSPEATEMLNSSSPQFHAGHVFNDVNCTTNSSSADQNPDGDATRNLNTGCVPNAENFPADSMDGNQDSGAMGISDPASANVSYADKCLTDFDLRDMEADDLELWITPASVNLPSAYEMPINFSDGNKKSNAGAITNPSSGLETNTTLHSLKSNDVNKNLDASAIPNPTGDNVHNISSLLMNCTDGMDELDFIDNLPNLHDLLMECSDDKQEAGVMAISNPTRGEVHNIGSLLMHSTDGKEELDFMDNVPNLQEFLMGCSDYNQEVGVMGISYPALRNPPNADIFSKNCSESFQFQEPNAMASANPIPFDVPYANQSSASSIDGYQELDVVAPSNPNAVYARNTSNYGMDSTIGTTVSLASANSTPFNVPYAKKTSAYSTDGYQELDVVAPPNLTAAYAHNSSNYGIGSTTRTAVSFSPISLTKANHSHSGFSNITPFNVPYANQLSTYSTDGYQKLDVVAPSNPTTGYAHNSSNYGMDSTTGIAVSLSPISLTNANYSHSEFTDLLKLGCQELGVVAPSNLAAGYTHNLSNYKIDTETTTSFPSISLTNTNHSRSEFADLLRLLQEPTPMDLGYWKLPRNIPHGSNL